MLGRGMSARNYTALPRGPDAHSAAAKGQAGQFLALTRLSIMTALQITERMMTGNGAGELQLIVFLFP